MDSLSDPGSLRNRAETEFREEQSVDDDDTFEYFRSIDGLVAVGVPNGEGSILLMNSPHGWRLPYGVVDVDEDWVAVGQRIGQEITGVSVEIASVNRVAQVDRNRNDSGEETTSYDVVFATEPVTGEPVSDSPEFGPWDDVELGWFETVPDDAYWEHGDAVDDIRSCVAGSRFWDLITLQTNFAGT